MLSEPLAKTMTLKQLAEYVEKADENSDEDFAMLSKVLAQKSFEITKHLNDVRDLVDNISPSL